MEEGRQVMAIAHLTLWVGELIIQKFQQYKVHTEMECSFPFFFVLTSLTISSKLFASVLVEQEVCSEHTPVNITRGS